MIFADSIFGSGCFWLLLILIGIMWAVGSIAASISKAAGNALKSDAFWEGARIGFWTWFYSDY